MEYTTFLFYFTAAFLLKSCHCQRTALLQNHGEFAKDEIADIKKMDFETFLSKTKLFLDKTLFIHMSLSRWKCFQVMSINYPAKWGKTTNLKMLRYFLEQQVDANGTKIPQEETNCFKLFTKGKLYKGTTRYIDFNGSLVLGRHVEFLYEHQGKYPVIYLDLNNVDGRNHREFVESMKKLLAQVFHSFSYLINGKYPQITEDSISTFNKIKDGKENDENVLIGSLLFLSQILNYTAHEQVCFLIDDYDEPINKTFADDNYPDKEKTEIFYKNFLRKTLKNNEYLMKAVLMGVQKLTQLNFSHADFEFIGEFTYLHTPFAEYHGFRTEDILLYYNHYGIPDDERDQVSKWYNGYQLPASGLQLWYNMYSVLHYLQKRKFECYWAPYGTADYYLKKALPLILFENAISILLTRSDYNMILYRFRFGMTDFERWKTKDPATATGIALEYLMQTGFLALNGKYTSRSVAAKVPIQIPNQEIFLSLKSKIIPHFVAKFKIPKSVDHEVHLQSIEHQLQQLLLNPNSSSTALKDSLEKFLSIVPPFGQQSSNLPPNNHTIRSIFNFVFARSNNFIFFGLDDLLFQYKRRGALLLVAFNHTFTPNELQLNENFVIWAYRYQIFVKTITIIQVNVMANKTVQLRHKLILNAMANVTNPPTTEDSILTVKMKLPTTNSMEEKLEEDFTPVVADVF